MATALQKMDLRTPKTGDRANTQMENWFTRSHKAAIVLASLSAEAAAAIVEEMSDDELRNFAKAFSELKTVSPQLLESVAEEFLSAASYEETDLAGGTDEARRVLTLMAKEERAERILADMGGGGESAVWTRVEKVEDEELAQYVQAQRMPIAATILSKLSYEKTAAVLNLAEPEYAQKVLLEIARKKPSSPDALEAISNVLEEELLKAAPGASGDEEDGEEPAPAAAKGNAGAKVGEIINYLPGVKRDALLEHFKEADPEVGAEVRRAVLTFEELYVRMPASGATALLRDLDREVLLKALKYGETNAQETVEFLFGNISKRMVEQYKEELAELETPSEEDGETAQREVTTVVRQLVNDGEFKLIPLKEPGEEESA